jgi:hypothetical protein
MGRGDLLVKCDSIGGKWMHTEGVRSFTSRRTEYDYMFHVIHLGALTSRTCRLSTHACL